MAKTMERLMVSIPPDVKREIEDVKKQVYYDKPYAELYRQIIRLGLDKMHEKASKKEGCEWAS